MKLLYSSFVLLSFCWWNHLCVYGTSGSPFGQRVSVVGQESLVQDFRNAFLEKDLERLRILLASGVPADTHIDQRGETPLHQAAFRNEKEIMELLLDYGADPNTISKGSLSPLLCCFTQSHRYVDAARILLEYGADPCFLSSVYKCTALDDALARNYTDAGKLLREYGSPLSRNKTHPNAQTPEWRAVLEIMPSKKRTRYPSFGGTRTATLEAWADSAVKNPKGEEAVRVMLEMLWLGNVEKLRQLLEAGVNPNFRRHGRLPIVEAARYKNYEAVRLLLDYGAIPHFVDARKFNAVTYLISREGVPASKEEELRILRLFLEYGYNTAARNGWGTSAAKDACYHDNTEAVALLASFGAYDEFKRGGSETLPFKSAETREAVETPRMYSATKKPTYGGKVVPAAALPQTVAPPQAPVPDLEVDIKKRHPDGQTELHVACSKGNTAMVKALIERGANVDERDNIGRTPLHVLCSRSQETHSGRRALKFIEILNLLMSASKKSLGMKDTAGRIPFHYLCENWRTREEVKEMLKFEPMQANVPEEKGTRMTPIFIAIRSASSDAALLLIESGVNVNQTLRDGTTPLHHAATRSLKSVVDVLMRAKGVNIDARDKDRKTPFLAACDVSVSSYASGNHIDVLKLLAERGANVKAVDKDRRSGLHLAVRSYNYEIVEFLLSLGVNVNAKDKRGRTPLDYCYSKSKISELLKRHGAE